MNARHHTRSGLQVIVLLLLGALLAGCGINNIPTLDEQAKAAWGQVQNCLLYTSPSPRDRQKSRMPSSA